MKIVITKSAEDALLESYLYICARNPNAANRIYDELMEFIFDKLTTFPTLGHLYNPAKNIYRLIHSKTGYNIYYIIKAEVIYVLYIIDGEMNLNQQLKDLSYDSSPDKHR